MVSRSHRKGRHRRAFCLLTTVAVLLLRVLPLRAQAERQRPVVYVFLPVDAKSSVLEKTLQDRLPALSVTVFSRFRDFEDAIKSGRSDAVVGIAPVLDLHARALTLQGMRGGKHTERYVLASVGQPLSGSMAGKTIGAVDLMGREGTQAFVAGLLKTTQVKVKRVAKVEDLLPLLEFSAADGIVLPGSLLARMLERTRLAIKTADLPDAEVSLPAVAVLNPAVRDMIVGSFQRLDGTCKGLLGIDSWSAR